MCLAIPGKLVQWLDRDPIMARGLVEFGGVQRECHLACVPEAIEGEYLIVHAGVAISRVQPEEAERMLQELAALGELDEAGP
jgi:hydrogenase expression/formation protein HypC